MYIRLRSIFRLLSQGHITVPTIFTTQVVPRFTQTLITVILSAEYPSTASWRIRYHLPTGISCRV